MGDSNFSRVVELRKKGMKTRQISEKTGIPMGSVSTILSANREGYSSTTKYQDKIARKKGYDSFSHYQRCPHNFEFNLDVSSGVSLENIEKETKRYLAFRSGPYDTSSEQEAFESGMEQVLKEDLDKFSQQAYSRKIDLDDLADELENAIGKLKRGQRIIIEKRYFEGIGPLEIANQFGLNSHQVIQMRLKTIYKNLRSIILSN